jgi:integrase
MAEIIKRGNIWYYRYVDHDGRRWMRKGCTDRKATEQMAASAVSQDAKVRSGMIDAKDIAYRDHSARPLSEHLAVWHKDMLAKGKTPRHATQYRERAARLIAIIMGTGLEELDSGRKPEALERAAKTLETVLGRAYFRDLTSEGVQESLAALGECGRSNQTTNHYRAALRAFLRWSRKRSRIRDNPMDCVESLAEQDPLHPRRALADDELPRLIHAAAIGPELFGMSGALRAIAYQTAALTGFRVSELRSLTPESFRLDDSEPSVFLRRSSTKNRKPADQPIPITLACELRDWIRDKPRGHSVFPLHHETAKAIRIDLEAAGIPYETEEGKADFHSLRAYYTSSLIHAGASVAEFQRLARHAKAETTLKHYAKVAPHNLRGAVEMLPSLTAPTPNALAATGTVGITHKHTLAPHLIHSGDASSVAESRLDVMAETIVPMATNAPTLGNEGSDASIRLRTCSEAERGGFWLGADASRVPLIGSRNKSLSA